MKRINLLDGLMQVTLTLFFAELVFPPLTTVGNSSVICLLCFISWFCLSIVKNRFFYLKCPIYVFVSCIYLLWVFLIAYIMDYSVIGNRYLGYSIVTFGYIIYKFHQQTNTMNVIKNAIIVTLILSVFTLFSTTSALLQDEFISRSIKSSGEYSESLAANGIGGYSFIYYIAIMTPITLQCFFVETKKGRKIICAIGYFFCLFLVYKSNYTTALLMTMMSSIILLYSKLSQKGRYPIFVFLVIMLIVLAIALFWNIHGKDILTKLPTRIARIFDYTSGTTMWEQLVAEFVVDRLPTIQSSIKAFMNAPLLGMVVSGQIEYISAGGYVLAGFGQHSYIMDTFALYGLAIGVCTIYLAFLPFRKKDQTKDRAFMYAIFISTIIVYTVNNATNSIAFAVCIIYPYVRDNICNHLQIHVCCNE